MSKKDNEYFHQLDPYIENLTTFELEILESRSKKLNQEKGKLDSGKSITALIFTLGNETYALETNFIFQSIELESITFLPGTSDILAGIINLRGNIIPVYHTDKLLGLQLRNEHQLKKLIILSKDSEHFGLLVSDIKGVENIEMENLTEEILLGHADENLIKGVTENSVILLDEKKIISDDRLILK